MQIVIVEDEVKIREGMGKIIEAQTGHVIVGEAADGEEGLQMVLRFKPDLVITDIRMPRKSGLEMLKELYERRIKVHSIILSGYSEFEYAKKAIRYGVDDYLLKPLAAEDVRNMLQGIEEKLEKEKKLVYGQPENRLKDILFGNVEESENNIEQLCRSCGFEPGMKYEMFAGYIGAANVTYREVVEQEIVELKEKYRDFKIYLVYQENRQIFYCLTAGKTFDAVEKEQYEHSFYHHMVLKYRKREERPVWVMTGCDEKNLRKTGEFLNKNLSYALVMEGQEWITEEMIEQYEAEPFEYPLEINSHLRNAICQGDSEEIARISERFLVYMRRHCYAPEDMRYGFMKSYYLVADTLQDIDQGLHEHLKNSGILRRMESVITWKELQGAYEDMIKAVAGARVKREDISNYVIKKAINYIREHYQEGITQEEVSRKLEITPEYLSTLFNREMGINFSLFLKQFRISHAKRLLKGTNMKIYEIAEAVGYSDAKYFARVFKEEQGISPGEYRQMN